MLTVIDPTEWIFQQAWSDKHRLPNELSAVREVHACFADDARCDCDCVPTRPGKTENPLKTFSIIL